MTHESLSEAVAAAVQAHCSHDGGLSFDADEMVLAMVSNLAFHLALVPALQGRAARKRVCRDVAYMLDSFMADAASDPALARFRGAVKAVPYEPGSVQ